VDITTDIIYSSVLVDGFIYHPSFGNVLHPLVFLLDTGATRTTILQGTAKKMKIDFSQLPKRRSEIRGIVGSANPYFVKKAVIGFLSKDQTQRILLPLKELNILKPEKEEDERFIYSLLGIDMIKRFEFHYNMPNVRLTLKDKYKRQGTIV